MATQRDPQLLGRGAECAAIDRLLGSVRDGQSAVLVVRGEAGIGKTALLEHCAGAATGFHLTRVAGVEAEMELAFAGVHQLCAPLLERMEALPAPQRGALSVALGRAAGPAPDRFLVGLAVLSLLSATAEERPLLCLVDDAQWLDETSRQVLGFVARRLLAESVATVFALRDPTTEQAFEHLPEMRLGGLGDVDARALLASALPGGLDHRVRDRIVLETHGNPLALVELPRGMSPADFAGGFEMPATADLPGHLEKHYLRRVADLPEQTRRLILLAAADPVGDATVVWRAAKALAIEPNALEPASSGELVEFGARISFRHPLVRSAVYRAASPGDRQSVHEALAQASDADGDADRRAWHRALAAAAPDEDVAAELERSAGRAQQRGGLAAAAAFLERSAALTPYPVQRGRRALAAAQAKAQAGAPETALRLLGQAEACPLDDLGRAQAHLVRGLIAFGSGHGGDAPTQLLAAARQLEPLDAHAARDTYLDAFAAAFFVGRLAGDVGLAEVARAVRAAPPSAGRPQDLLLDGFATVITEGQDAGAAALRDAVSAFRGDLPPEAAIRWLWLATHAAHDLWDDEAWAELCTRHLALAREAGALAVLPLALSARIGLHLFAGELDAAASLVEEIDSVTRATGSGLPPYGALALAAYQGRAAEAEPLIAAVREEIGPRGDGMGMSLVEHAAAVLFNGLGRYGDACEAAQRGAAHPQDLAFSAWSLPQLVEAAVRDGRRALAEDALHRLETIARACATDWSLGIEARSRALVSDDADAEPWYREAIERLARTGVRGELARAHLLYGEWLRRGRRRIDARDHLRTAHEMFQAMGMEAFAERARRERSATGEKVRSRRPEDRDELTPQEAQIAQMARGGLSNPEIGARLFLSPRTVEWHLKKVFGKLDIGSRRELVDVLPSGGAQPTAA